MHVIESATGKVLSDTIDRAQFGQPSWFTDDSFFYARTPKLGCRCAPDREIPEACVSITTCWAQIPMTNPRYSGTRYPRNHDRRGRFSFVAYSPGAPEHLVAVVIHGVKREIDVFTSRRSVTKWTPTHRGSKLPTSRTQSSIWTCMETIST